MLKGKTVVLGVTGGIAAYKSAEIVSRLKKLNCNVEVVMTDGAKEFITPLTMQTMSGNVVHNKMFNNLSHYDVEHVSLAQKGDLIVIAPATANTINKIYHGICDNLLTTIAMASTVNILFAPAMNTYMYENPSVETSIKGLKERGYKFIEPGSGLLACGDVGKGKMAEPEDIVDEIIYMLYKKDLDGYKITVTAGPTISPLDPVRYLTNRSTGRMGYSLAKEAYLRGAEVSLISGPTGLEPPKGVRLINVETTEDMLRAVEDEFQSSDVIIKSAAPLDYKVRDYKNEKIKKLNQAEDGLDLALVRNPDIAQTVGKKKAHKVLVGFAAETNDVYKNALDKVKRKNFDFIVANDVTKEGAGFKSDTNIVNIITGDGHLDEYPLMKKTEVAEIILDRIKLILEEKAR